MVLDIDKDYTSILLTNENLRTLPEVPAVYFVKDLDEEVLYVGRTENLQYRWRYHHLIERQLSCIDYWKMSLCWYVDVENIYKLESDLIKEWRPAWNCQDNTDYYRPTHKLDFVAFCVDCVSCYGGLVKGRASKKTKVTYETTTREPIPLKKKSFGYGDIPQYLVKFEWLLEEAKIGCPISLEDLDPYIAEAKENGGVTKHLYRMQRVIAKKEGKEIVYSEPYVSKSNPAIGLFYKNRYKKGENFVSIKDKVKNFNRC